MPAAIIACDAVPRNRCDGCVGSAFRRDEAAIQPPGRSDGETDDAQPVEPGDEWWLGGTLVGPQACLAWSFPPCWEPRTRDVRRGAPPEPAPSAGAGSESRLITAYIHAIASIVSGVIGVDAAVPRLRQGDDHEPHQWPAGRTPWDRPWAGLPHGARPSLSHRRCHRDVEHLGAMMCVSSRRPVTMGVEGFSGAQHEQRGDDPAQGI